MSLPALWVDRIFDKLTLVYGRDFMGRWEGLNMGDVKTDWGHELDGLEANPKAIAYALHNLPAEKPPTVLQFRAIAHKCPSENQELVALPRLSAERVATELLRLGELRGQTVKTENPHGMKAWAHRLKARHEAGDNLAPHQISCYRTALGIVIDRDAV